MKRLLLLAGILLSCGGLSAMLETHEHFVCGWTIAVGFVLMAVSESIHTPKGRRRK